MNKCELNNPYLGRTLLLIVIAVLVCVLVWLGQELPAIVMALGAISAAVLAISASSQSQPKGASA